MGNVISSCDVAMWSDVGAFLMWCNLIYPGPNNSAFYRTLAKSIFKNRSISSVTINATIEELLTLGHFKSVGKSRNYDYCTYRTTLPYSSDGLAALRNRALDSNWLSAGDNLQPAANLAKLYGVYEIMQKYNLLDRLNQRSRVIASLIGCGTYPFGHYNTLSSDMIFDATALLTGYLAEDAVLLRKELTGKTDPRILPAAAAALFLCGRDVGGLLDALQPFLVQNHESLPSAIALAYAALRFWRGEFDAINGLDGLINPGDTLKLKGIENAFKAASLGQWQTALVTLVPPVHVRAICDPNPILLPYFILVYAICCRTGRTEELRKLSASIERSLPSQFSAITWDTDRIRERVIDWAVKLTAGFGRTDPSRSTPDEVSEAIANPQPAIGAIPLALALHSPSISSVATLRKTITSKTCDHLILHANRLKNAQYAMMPGLLISAVGRFNTNATGLKELRDWCDASGKPQLMNALDKDSEWKNVVGILSKILGIGQPKAEPDKNAKSKSGSIVWGLAFKYTIPNRDSTADSKQAYPAIAHCVYLRPYFRGPRSPSTGEKDRAITIKTLKSDAYCGLMTDQDRDLANEIEKSPLSRYNYLSPAMSIIARLVGHPCVIEVPDPNDCYISSSKPRQLMFENLNWNVTSKMLPDGGMEISLPSYLKYALDEPVVIKFGPDDARFLQLSEKERGFIKGFLSISDTGTITLPKVALEAASPVLAEMAKVVPMEGSFTGLADTSGLERVSGETVPTTRLEFAEGILRLELCVKPYPTNEALVLKPGVGSPERMVKDGSVTKVLVRDLDGERKRSKSLVEVMEPFAGWSDDDGRWMIEDLEDALSALATLKDMGDEVRMEWREGTRLNLATAMKSMGRLTSKEGADRWFRVDGTFEIDEHETLSLLQLLKLYRGRIGRFVSLGERGYLRLSSALMKRLEALDAAGRDRDGGLNVAPAALPMIANAFGDNDKDLTLPEAMKVEADRIREALDARHAMPERLKATLRSYQEEGFEWLARLAGCGFGACLADDMGLGKTVQLIALMLLRAGDGASLVVAPTSVGGNWRAEIRRFAPTLKCLCAWEAENEEWLKAGPHDVVITSYGMLVSREAKFCSREWNGVVLDEAQAIKNESTERARIVKRLAAKFRVAATGTPIENRLTELWSIFDFLNPGMLGSLREFIARLTVEGRATPQLKALVRPLILRRLKRDVLDDLPEKTEITLTVQLDQHERSGYEACRLAALKTLGEGGKENRISILAELTRLRRYCCHPSLVMPEMSESAKMEALVELLRDLKGANHRALVFSQFTDYLALVESRLRAEGISYQYLDGTTPPHERERRVEEFQRGEGDVFLMSLKAGGTGLNLTSANYVVLLDPWWNPAVEDQAADRVHRIGQKNPVTVYRLIAADTVEERVLELHAEKKQVASDVLDGTGSTALTPEVLMRLFG